MKPVKESFETHQKNQQLLDGVYGSWGIFISIAILLVLAILDTSLLRDYFLTQDHRVILFTAIMMNSLGAILLSLPYVQRKTNLNENWLKSFLALPDDNAPVNFQAISGFFGEQALGGFLATVLFLLMKQTLNNFGPIVSGFVCFVIVVPSLLIITFSLLRFVMIFTRFSWKVYGFVSAFSLAVMLGFYWAGIESVSQ